MRTQIIHCLLLESGFGHGLIRGEHTVTFTVEGFGIVLVAEVSPVGADILYSLAGILVPDPVFVLTALVLLTVEHDVQVLDIPKWTT